MNEKNFELFRGPLKGFTTSGLATSGLISDENLLLPSSSKAPESANLPPSLIDESIDRETVPLTVKTVYLRIIALIFLYLAVLQWFRLMGYGADVSQNYLDFSAIDRIYLVFFAIIYPIIAVGLWAILSWGRVIWYLGCIFHFVFYFSLTPSIFNTGEVLFHFISVTIYLLSIILLFFIGKKKW